MRPKPLRQVDELFSLHVTILDQTTLLIHPFHAGLELLPSLHWFVKLH